MSASQKSLQKFLTSHPKVSCKNLDSCLEKLSKIKSEGLSKLYFVSDFDATLSKHHDQNDVEKKRLPSTFGVLEEDPNLPKNAALIAKNNYEKYYPIEMNSTISFHEKLGHMNDWWTSTQNAVASSKSITKSGLINTVINSKVELRDEAEKFINDCNELEIPCIIFSAGCGDIIDLMLKNKEPICWHEKNMILVSNMLIFEQTDENEEILTAWTRPKIHSLNKNSALERLKSRASGENGSKSSKELMIKSQKEFEKLSKLVEDRSSVITMGDHLNDPKMKDGIPGIENTFDIGFLNYAVDKNLENYLNAFDMVLVDDQSFEVVNEIFRFLSSE